jgi:TonB family protein
MKSIITIYVLVLIAICFSVTAAVAQDDRNAGMQAFQTGDYSTAINVFKKLVKKDAADAEAWDLLGSSYLKIKKLKEAIKASETAVTLQPKNDKYHATLAFAYLLARDRKADRIASETLDLNPDNADAHYILGVNELRSGSYDMAYQRAKRVIELVPNHAGAYRLKSRALLGSFAAQTSTIIRPPASPYDLLPEAARDLEKFLALTTDPAGRKDLEDELEALKFFAQYYSLPEHRTAFDLSSPPPEDPSKTPLSMTHKPYPGYSDEARNANIQGTIIIMAAFGADGKVGPVMVVRSLGGGLDEKAIAAAKGITFQPASKDGIPQTVVRSIEYTFSIY